MSEPLDELLRGVPIEPMPIGLPARIQIRLRVERAREQRKRMLLDGFLMVLVVSGALALWPQLGGAAAWLPSATPDSSAAWLGNLASDPAATVWQALTSAVGWTGRLADGMGVAGLVGLILLAIPGFTWLLRWLPGSQAAGDGIADRVEMRLEDGARA